MSLWEKGGAPVENEPRGVDEVEGVAESDAQRDAVVRARPRGLDRHQDFDRLVHLLDLRAGALKDWRFALGLRVRIGGPSPAPLVLSGHAVSLTPY